MLNRQFPCVVTVAFCYLGLVTSGSARADLVYNVSVDTSALNAQSGNLDFQFNPGDATAEAATASVTGFQTTGGALAQPASLTGDATGSLPGTLTLMNDQVYNDIFQGFTFGTGFSFTVTLAGPAVASPGGTTGSTFAVSLFAVDGVTPLLTTDPNGSVATIDLNPNGTASVYTFAQSPTDSTPVATVTGAVAVPEPSGFVIAVVAIACLGSVRACRHRRVVPARAVSHCKQSGSRRLLFANEGGRTALK